ncbi:Ig-like domain-containing protein [Aquiflexum sp. TKW24L]|uniref:fibronectin type III domain-containing protein n=1 Tax=Aquiflexum sp. TKW24L TaxID=2942212 RepID=UPI0020C185FA|nr:Ig-like domain-containing protein [Aquiflexum sp. TKW24L]MCL6260786.1 Ig-like domain-containing protein [Aquiflexum sp. TKW24L]
MSPTVIINFKVHVVLIFLLFCSQPIVLYSQSTPAFPGASGFGKYTTGGRGGKVFIVTNLNDSGQGSLREAVEASGTRTAVFEVSGNIHLKSRLNVGSGNLTIAGQTAPGDGITLQNYPFRIMNKSNIIIRFIRFRLGDLAGEPEDSFEVREGSNNFIIDHCSFSWGIDETCSIYDIKKATLQYCLISEGLNSSVHSKGNHGYGSLIGGEDFSLYQNLWSNFLIRNPAITTVGLNGVIDIRNNVIYNWGQRSTDNGSLSSVNMYDNYYKPGPASFQRGGQTPLNFLWPTGDPGTYGKFYLEGNQLVGRPEVKDNQWIGVRLENAEATKLYLESCKNKDSNGKLVPFPIPTGLYTRSLSSEEGYDAVLNHAGASLFRDAVDKRLVEEVRTGTVTFKGSKTGIPGIIDSQKDVGGWPVLKSTTAPKDTDRDGMPDAWEVENGLNPNLADNNGYNLSSSYTNIEVYINSLVKHISELDATTPPSIPQLESPLNNTLGVAINPTLKWKSAANALNYQLQVSKTQDFATLVANVENLSSLQYSFQKLAGDTQYYWRVRAKNSKGTSSWSSIWNFKTVTSVVIPEVPKPISPTNGSLDLSTSLFLEWGAVDGAKTYRVQVAKDESFTSIVYDIYNLTNPGIEIKNLTSGSSFFWKVLATNGAGSSNFSNAWGFTTKTSSITETVPVTGISISPTKASLEISKTLQLVSTLSPSNASNKTVTWTSSDPTIAGVSSSGLVTGIKSGSANVTAKSQDGNFTATSQITVSTSVTLSISGFTLVNADTDSDIITISNGTTIDINQIKGINLNIRVNTNPTPVGSVSIKLSGPVSESITENVVPYALFGDSRGNYNGKILPEGNYILEAIPYSESNLAGTKGNLLSIGFTIGQKVIAPTAPTLTSPANNSTGLPTNPKLSWSAVSNAETYAVEVSRNSDFSTLVSNSKLLSINEVSISGLQEDVLYYWRVRATNQAGSSPYSTVWNFRTKKPASLPAVPTLVSPTNGAKDLSTSLTLQWNAGVGAKTYGVQISKESNFASLFLDNPAVTSTSLQVNNLQAGVTYYWRVSATNESGSSNYSSVWSFQTKLAVIPPPAPVLTSPSNNATGLATTLKLTWNVVTSASGYALEVSKNSDFKTLDIDIKTLKTNEFTVSGLQEDTSYFWRVRASNSAGNSPYSTVWTFRTIKPIPVPAAPNLVSPSNGAKDLSVSPRLQWNTVTGAKTYRVQISKEINFATLSLDNAAVTSNSLQVSGLQDGVTYYWRVRATNESGSSSYSSVWSFQTKLAAIPPPAPTLRSPSNNATGLATTLKLTWNVVTSASGYALEVSKNSDFKTLDIDIKTLKTNEFTVSGLQDDTSYFWRVRASNSAGNSPYSTVWTFRTIKPIPVPAAPNLVSPSNGAKDLSISPRLQWNTVTGAKTYRVQISKEINFATLSLDNAALTSNSLQVNNLEEGETYYWRVSAGNEAGNSAFSSVWSFNTRISLDPPIAPTLVSPSDNDIGLSTAIKLTWTLITEADKYGIEVSTNKDFSSIISSNFTLKDNEFTVSGLQEETQYFWRVNASNSAGVSGWSSVWSFTTKEKINPPSAPILLGPANESVGLTGKTVFTWTKSDGADVYGIQISKDASFTLIQVDLSSIQVQSFETNSLEKGVTYYWRVFASNEGGRSEFSEIWKFETLNVPDAPTLQSPSNGKKDLEINPKLVWKSAAGADSYRLQVSKSKDFSQNIVDNSNLVETFITIQNLEEGITYYWRVRATNIAGNSAYSPIWEFSTKKPLKAPTAPILVSPISSIILDKENIMLEWKPVIDAERYQVQVSKYSNFSQAIVIEKNSITTDTFKAEGLEPNQVYFWRVMAINIVGTSPYSTVWNFVTKPLPILDLPVLLSPGDSTTLDSTSVAFLWDAVEEAEYYQLDVSSDSTFKENVMSFTQILETEFELDSLERDVNYYWKITAKGKRPSSVSETWHFIIAEDQAALLARLSPVKIKTYPNPFTDIINLEFSKPIEGEVNISIFDGKGSPVFESKVTDPKERISLEIPQGLPAGIYVIKVQGFGVMESKRLVKR